jgi:hypothetical protein
MNDQWNKSSYSNSKGGACVEARVADGPTVQVRDTENRSAGHLSFPAEAWRAFVADLSSL